MEAWYWLFVTAPLPACPTIKLLVYLQVLLVAEERLAAVRYAVQHSDAQSSEDTAALSKLVKPDFLLRPPSFFISFFRVSFLQLQCFIFTVTGHFWPTSLCCHQCLKVQAILSVPAVCSVLQFASLLIYKQINLHHLRMMFSLLCLKLEALFYLLNYTVVFYQIIQLMCQIFSRLHHNFSWILLK